MISLSHCIESASPSDLPDQPAAIQLASQTEKFRHLKSFKLCILTTQKNTISPDPDSLERFVHAMPYVLASMQAAR